MSSCTDSVPLYYCTTGIFRQESVVGCVWMCECTDYQIIHKKMTQKQKKKQRVREHDFAVGTISCSVSLSLYCMHVILTSLMVCYECKHNAKRQFQVEL